MVFPLQRLIQKSIESNLSNQQSAFDINEDELDNEKYTKNKVEEMRIEPNLQLIFLKQILINSVTHIDIT